MFSTCLGSVWHFISLFGRKNLDTCVVDSIYFVCLCFDFRWLETEIGSDIVGFMKTDSVQMHGSRCW